MHSPPLDGPKKDHAVQATAPKSVVKALSRIPGIGPSLASDLYLLGIESVEDLKDGDPEILYDRLVALMGVPIDRCVLYTFRCAVYFATETAPEPDKLKWWHWKD